MAAGRPGARGQPVRGPVVLVSRALKESVITQCKTPRYLFSACSPDIFPFCRRKEHKH